MSLVKGFITRVSEYKSGNNARGQWSVQHVVVKGDDDSSDVSVWCRPDFSSAVGKYIEIDGVSQSTKDQSLELRDGKGSIAVKDVTPRGTTATKTTTPETRRTIDEYFEVLDLVVDHVLKKCGNLEGTAHIINGTMVAFAKGEFVSEKKESPLQ